MRYRINLVRDRSRNIFRLKNTVDRLGLDSNGDFTTEKALRAIPLEDVPDQYRYVITGYVERIVSLSQKIHRMRADLKLELAEDIVIRVEYICNIDWPDETKVKLKDLAEEISKFRKKVEKARNKVIAHADVKTYIQNIALGEFNQEDEEKFWDALQKFVDLVYDKTFSGPFPINATLSGDAISLIAMLKDAVYFDDLVKKDSKLLIDRFRNDRYENA